MHHAVLVRTSGVHSGLRAPCACRRAFLHSSSPNKDVALVSLANVLHMSGYTVDAVTAMQMAIQVAPKMALNHFTMANILFALGEQSSLQAAFFYEATLRFQAEFSPALSRLLRLRCQSKYEVANVPG